MTLSTDIAIRAPGMSARQVYEIAARLIHTPVERIADPVTSDCAPSGRKSIGNPPGIGCSAWLEVTYAADGPLTHHCDPERNNKCLPVGADVVIAGKSYGPQEQGTVDYHDEQLRDNPTWTGWATHVVNYDTGYGYRADNGANCDDLHAALIVALRGTFPHLRWCNEYTGEWFDGCDGLDRFADHEMGAEALYEEVTQLDAPSGVRSANRRPGR